MKFAAGMPPVSHMGKVFDFPVLRQMLIPHPIGAKSVAPAWKQER